MERKTIDKIVKASGVKNGELILVHFWGEEEARPLLHDFCAAVASAGGFAFPLQQARTQNASIFNAMTEGGVPTKYYNIFQSVDAVLDVFAYRPVVLNHPLKEEQMDLYRQHMSGIFQALRTKKRFTQIRIPTEENAAESGLDPADFIVRMEKAYDIDYEKLKEACERKIDEYKKTKRILLHTGNDCVLTLVTEGREWFADCGDGDWPCGEVAIAPVEALSEGTVWYDTFWLSDEVFTDVTLTVNAGRIVSSDHLKVNEFLMKLSDNEKVLCELGFGCNENVTELCGYIVLDEKMQDTFHIAIGDNTLFCGQNSARLHMDFVGRAVVEKIE